MMMTFTNIQSIEDRYTSGAYYKRPLALVRGAGCQVWDAEGNGYLDATSGQGVALIGHCHPAIVAALTMQAQTLITSPEIFYNGQRAMLYEMLSEALPAGFGRYFLCNSGAEAIEGALKVARLLTGRNQVVGLMRAFHGRTLGALGLTWNPRYRESFAGWQPDFAHVPANNHKAIDEALTDDVAAVFVEVVQGEGGVHPLSADYLQAVRRLCDERGILLIVDEIQTGLGRTGRWFAFEHAGIVPDVVVMGKGLAGGLPMGAVAWRAELGTIEAGTHGSTFGGNPLVCACACATLHTLQSEQLVENACLRGLQLQSRLQNEAGGLVREVRGLGLMIGLELRARVTPVLQRLQARGVLALPAGTNVLRLLPPLTISEREADHLASVVIAVLQEAV